MRLGELIEKLQAVQREHGDWVPVKIPLYHELNGDAAVINTHVSSVCVGRDKDGFIVVLEGI